MGSFVKNESVSNANFIHIYSEISKDELDEKINNLLLSNGYRIKERQLGNTTYVKGNIALRILFGVFCNYFKFNITISSNSSCEFKVEVKKDTSGILGGLFGIVQVKNEFKRLAQILQTI